MAHYRILLAHIGQNKTPEADATGGKQNYENNSLIYKVYFYGKM